MLAAQNEMDEASVARLGDRELVETLERLLSQERGLHARAGAATGPAKSGSRHIPHRVRREVIARDGACCTYVSPDGQRCPERGQLELHHEQPFGRGGPATASNIRILCRSHNQLLAERDYGRSFTQQRILHAQRERDPRQLAPRPARGGS